MTLSRRELLRAATAPLAAGVATAFSMPRLALAMVTGHPARRLLSATLR